MMAPKRKPASSRPVVVKAPQEFVISSGMIKWVVSIVGGLLVAYTGWKVVWDDIRTYWRLETIQQAKDKETETKLKAVAQRAEVGRAWVFYSIADAKAFNAQQWATFCKALKLPSDACDQLKEQARQYHEEAVAAKSSANEAGKDK